MKRFLTALVASAMLLVGCSTAENSSLLDWVREELLTGRLISPADIDLLHVTDEVDEAVELVVEGYHRRLARDGAAPPS